MDVAGECGLDTEISELVDVAEREGFVSPVCDGKAVDSEELLAVATTGLEQTIHKPQQRLKRILRRLLKTRQLSRRSVELSRDLQHQP